MVAVNRANRKESSDTKPKGGNALQFANSITKQWQTGIIPAKELPIDKPPGIIVPVVHVDLDHPPPPPAMNQAQTQQDQEEQQFRQIKLASFNEAVKSKTSGIMTDFQTGMENNKNNANGIENAKNNAGKKDRWHMDSKPEAPETDFVLRTGFVIPALMISAINSQLPGPVIGQVSQDVFDSATGKFLLIPQGTRLFGFYSNEIIYGQARVMVAWQRIIFPDGKAMDLGEMPGTDGAGLAGLTGDVNNHYVRIFGNAMLMSLITAAATYSQQPNNTNAPLNTGYQQTASGALSSALGQQLGMASSQLLMKNLNLAPTIDVRAGYRLNVVATKDLTFDKPYVAFSE